MRPTQITQTGVGTTPWIPMDFAQAPFAVGVGVVLVSGSTITYTVEHTFDDIYDSTVVPVAFANTGLTAQTVSKDGNYAFPVRAIRLNVTAGTAPVVAMTLIQGSR